jgi:acyl-CoA synthetase (AMP-forming)/AMP-acid ligase II
MKPNSTSQHANLAWLLWCEAELRGESPAIASRDTRATYRELRERAGGFAASVAGAGVLPGERVAIFLDSGVDAAAAYFGVIAAGATAIVVDETIRRRQLEFVLRHSDTRLLLTSKGMLTRIGRPFATKASIIDSADVPAAVEWTPVARDADDPVQIIYTNGAAGMPKGVVHGHGALRRAMEICVEYLGLTPVDRVAGLHSFSTISGVTQFLSCIAAGGILLLARLPVAAHAVELLREWGVTIMAAGPSLWTELLCTAAFTERPIGSLRQMQNAGGHLPRELVRRLRIAQPQAELMLQYGSIETVCSTVLPASAVDRHPDSIGGATPGAEIMVLRDDLTPSVPGELGELVHRGPTTSLGYLDDPDATARAFRAFPFGDPDATERVVFTGDMVRQDEDGYLYFVGRRDRLITTQGFRVGPDEIIDSLHTSGEVHEAQISSVPDAACGARIIAHVVLARGGRIDRLERFCKSALPRWMQPSRFIVHDRIPTTPSGEHDLEALRQMVSRELASEGARGGEGGVSHSDAYVARQSAAASGD